MPSTLRLSRKELLHLVEATEDAGGDATELRTLLSELDKDGQGKPRRPWRSLSTGDEELTAQERLEFEAGHLFPSGITDDIFAKLWSMIGTTA